MKRVSTEVDALGSSEREANREFLLLQGVRFAFRVHQVMFFLFSFHSLFCIFCLVKFLVSDFRFQKLNYVHSPPSSVCRRI